MVLKNLISKEIRHLRWFVIIGLILNAALAVLTVTTFHYLGQITRELPGELLEILVEYEIARELLLIFGDYSLYVWSQWHAKNLYQLASLSAIIIAALQFAGEINKNTMGFYLTRPVTRRDGYLGKTMAGLILLLLVFGGGTIFFWIASACMGYAAEWGRLLAALIISLVWIAGYYLLACLISTLMKEPVFAGVMAGVCGLILSLPGLFGGSRSFSIFYQMRAVDYFIAGQPAALSIGPGLVFAGVLFWVGLRVFEKKDF